MVGAESLELNLSGIVRPGPGLQPAVDKRCPSVAQQPCNVNTHVALQHPSFPVRPKLQTLPLEP